MATIKFLKTGRSYEVMDFLHKYESMSEKDDFVWMIPEIIAKRVDGVITVNGVQITSTYYGMEELQLINSDLQSIEYAGRIYDMEFPPERAMLYDALKTELSIENLEG